MGRSEIRRSVEEDRSAKAQASADPFGGNRPASCGLSDGSTGHTEYHRGLVGVDEAVATQGESPQFNPQHLGYHLTERLLDPRRGQREGKIFGQVDHVHTTPGMRRG